MDKMIFEVYTDGACTNNQGVGGQPGGWAAVFVDGPSYSGGELVTTNNRMEMKAVIEALKHIPKNSPTKIYSDSAYVVNCFRQKWIDKWEKNGWMNSQKKPVENQDLWKELRLLQKERKVEWIKVKGHSGNKWNERADRLAVSAIPNKEQNQISHKQDLAISISLNEGEVKRLIEIMKEKQNNDTQIQSILLKLETQYQKFFNI